MRGFGLRKVVRPRPYALGQVVTVSDDSIKATICHAKDPLEARRNFIVQETKHPRLWDAQTKMRSLLTSIPIASIEGDKIGQRHSNVIAGQVEEGIALGGLLKVLLVKTVQVTLLGIAPRARDEAPHGGITNRCPT